MQIPLNIRQSEDFPVDLYVVMDVTYTMKNDLDNLKVLGAVIGNYTICVCFTLNLPRPVPYLVKRKCNSKRFPLTKATCIFVYSRVDEQ